MARIRSTFPGQWTDEDFVTCTFPARLLILALRNEADDQGVFEWKPVGLKMRLMPADAVDMDALLAELVANHHVKRFEIAGRVYGAIRNFVKWQKPKKPSRVYPLPVELGPWVRMDLWPKPKSSEQGADEASKDTEPTHDDDDQNSELSGGKADAGSELDGGQDATGTEPFSSEDDGVRNLFGTGTETDAMREEGGGRKRKNLFRSVGDADATNGAGMDGLFQRFWSAMPKRGQNDGNPRKPARLKFEREVKRGVDPEDIIRGAEAYAKQVRAAGKDRTEHVAQGITFLNQERWCDCLEGLAGGQRPDEDAEIAEIRRRRAEAGVVL